MNTSAISETVLAVLALLALWSGAVLVRQRRAVAASHAFGRTSVHETPVPSEIFSRIDDACFIMDTRSIILFADLRLHALLGYKPGVLAGVPCARLFALPLSPGLPGEGALQERPVDATKAGGARVRVMLKGLHLWDRAGNVMGTLVRVWKPSESTKNIGSTRTLEQIWETLLESQQRDLERKNVELEASGAQLQRLVERIGSIKDREGYRISKVLSDELFGLLQRTRANVAVLASEVDAVYRGRVLAVLSVADSAVATVDRIIEGIRPPMLEGDGLVGAIESLREQFERTHRLDCRTRIEVPEGRIPTDFAAAVYRIVQESLTNIARHAGATAAEISLTESDEGILLEVTDNGRGIPDEALMSGNAIGLLGMSERAKSLGGRLGVRRREAGGTIVSLLVPVEREP